MSEVQIGDCGCVSVDKILRGKDIHAFYGEYCYKTKTIRLGKLADENEIEKVLNHEYLHKVIAEIEHEITAQLFDETFYLSIKMDTTTRPDGTPTFLKKFSSRVNKEKEVKK